jgi:uncharacterized LabA/DUF88 family protein
MNGRVLGLIDGENLVFRYQAMLEAGWIPYEHVVHIPDVFVWHNNLFGLPIAEEVLRVVFYTSVVGDDQRVSEIRDSIQREAYALGGRQIASWDRLSAFLVKKDRASRRSKAIDMRICIDALAHTMNRNMDVLHLATGDADFVPLVEEIMRRGIRVRIYAFSDGCAQIMRAVGDCFTSLDDVFFKPRCH